MKVIIPAAGVGTRLRPHTHTTPKSLLHVAGKPILGHILDKVALLNFSETIIVVGFFGDMIRKYVEENYDFPTRFVEQRELKGLGYAIYLASEFITDEPVLIVLGDTIYQADLDGILNGGENAIGIQHVDEPQRFGIAEIENGFVRRLVEKPAKPESNLAVVGIYFIKDTIQLRASLEEIVNRGVTTKGEYQLTDALQQMIDNGIKIKTFEVDGWYDCGKPQTLLSTNQHLLSNIGTPQQIEGSVIIPPVFISPSAKVTSSIIGPDVSVADEAIISGSIIRNSIIGQKAEVYDCIMESSLIGDYAHVKMEFKEFNVGDSSEIGYR